MSGMLVSVLFINWLETDQLNFQYVDMSHGIQKVLERENK